jgi:hypothetical protein
MMVRQRGRVSGGQVGFRRVEVGRDVDPARAHSVTKADGAGRRRPREAYGCMPLAGAVL